MKYVIDWCETIKTGEKNGKMWTMTKMSLKGEDGKVTENVTTFDHVGNGQTINGEIVQNGQYLNFQMAKAVAGAGFKAAQIEKTMERKEQSIGKFQDNKEYSIMVASSMSQAVALAIAELNNQGLHANDLADRITYWRNWVITNWNVEKTDTPAF